MSDTKRKTWAYVYGDECDFLWEHFGMPDRDPLDRIKIKLISYQTSEEVEEELGIRRPRINRC